MVESTTESEKFDYTKWRKNFKYRQSLPLQYNRNGNKIGTWGTI